MSKTGNYNKIETRDDREERPREVGREGNTPVPLELDDLVEEPAGRQFNEDINLDVILDIPVSLTMEVGCARISIRDLLQLNPGSVIELDRLAGEPLDIKVNGMLVAHGEVVVINEKFGIRVTDVISRAERVKKLT